MHNLSLIDEEDRYYNWYTGKSALNLPFWGHDITMLCNIEICNLASLRYFIDTFATSGTILTNYFGEKIKKSQIEKKILARIFLRVPQNAVNNENITFHVEVEKFVMNGMENYIGTLNDEKSKYEKKFSPPEKQYALQLHRQLTESDILDLDEDVTPSFKIKWHYNSNIPDTSNDSFLFTNFEPNISFKRYFKRHITY